MNPPKIGREALRSSQLNGQAAEAIRDSLHMGQRERVTRSQTMIGPLRKHGVSWWAAAFLKELA